jgi:uncharacterized membrane protein YoaT (DUF817 family)
MSDKQDTGKLFTNLFWEILAFTTLIGSIIIFWQNNLVLLTAVLIQCLVALWYWHERYDITFFLVISVFGTVAEGVFVRSGIWQYNNPTLYGVPLWFPFAFGTTALISQRLALTLTEIWNKVAQKR